MTPLTLDLKQRTTQRVVMSPLVCQLLTDKKTVEIGKITFQNGKDRIQVDELFTLSGEDSSHIVIKNSTEKLDYIGKHLNGGVITIEDNVGAYLAMSMQSGIINVSGNTGLYSACEMKGGLLQIEGNAGDFVVVLCLAIKKV